MSEITASPLVGIQRVTTPENFRLSTSSFLSAISTIKNITISTLSICKETVKKPFIFIKDNGYVVGQCGPQVTVPCLNHQSTVDINTKMTCLCTKDSCHVFPFHFEVATKGPSAKEVVNWYNLWVKQIGWEIQSGGRRNPLKWKYICKLETLEHTEITKTLFGFEYPLKGTGQTLVGFEIGRTITEKSLSCLCSDIFSSNPTATAHALWEIFHHTVLAHFWPEIESDPVTLEQPVAQNDPEENHSLSYRFACGVAQAVKKALLASHPDEVIWFNIIFGPCEINAGVGIGVPDALSADWLVTCYPRLKGTLEFVNGEFVLPKNIKCILDGFHKIKGTWEKVSAFINKTRKLSVKECDDNASAIVIINKVFDYLDSAIEECRIDKIPREEFLSLLAKASHCRFMVNDPAGEFTYDFENDDEDPGQNQIKRTFIINNTKADQQHEDKKNENNTDENHKIDFMENYQILTAIAENEEQRRALTAKILENFPEVTPHSSPSSSVRSIIVPLDEPGEA